MGISGLHVGLGLVAAAAIFPTAASASSAGVYNGGSVQYDAAAGEQNVVTVSETPSDWVFHEAGTNSGAPIAITVSGCSLTDTQTARCPKSGGSRLMVSLDDLDDHATSTVTSASVPLLGGTGDDVLTGGPGPDSLFGNEGADELHGGAGDDSLMGGLGPDVLDGGAGIDEVQYYAGGDDGARTHGVTVTLGGSAADDGGPEDDLGGVRDNVGANVENFWGTAFGDTVTGNASDNTLLGYDGADSLSGGDGNDTLDGGPGADQVFGQGGDDYLKVADLAADAATDCGDGNDSAQADTEDPLVGCETVNGATAGAGGAPQQPATTTLVQDPALATPAPDTTAPVVSQTLPATQSAATLLRSGVDAGTIQLNEAGTVTTEVLAPSSALTARTELVVLGRTVKKLVAAGKVHVRVKLNAKGKRALRRLRRKLTLTVRTTVTDNAGNKRVITRKIRVKPRWSR